jgi:hypothetical protein
MTCTYRAGAATGHGSMAYARYVIESALSQEHSAAAAYYAGDTWARDVPEPAAELRPDQSWLCVLSVSFANYKNWPAAYRKICIFSTMRSDGERQIQGRRRRHRRRPNASASRSA